ncbi:hypothetical protein F5B19DRAFT_355003 [Rostrohypoxylon terebratum]|nr:hypothetical protein F5B19DRAFT_355003 [Rostrohypoxylon terebratum]
MITSLQDSCLTCMRPGCQLYLGIQSPCDTECLSSLFFEELNARRTEVQKMGRARGTTEWILEHEVYKQWLGRDSSLLWIHGKAGSGKSTLAAALQQRLIPQDTHEVLKADFFYSTLGGSTKKGHLWMLRSILYQLLEQQQNLYCFYKDSFRRVMERIDRTWEYNDLRDVLLRLGDQFDDSNDKYVFFLILDGLDESEDSSDSEVSRKQTFNLFSQLCHLPKKGIFKVIALSRSEYTIRQALNPKYLINMGIENKGSIEKIARYGIYRIYHHINSNADSVGGPGTYNSSSIEIEDAPDIHDLGFLKTYLLNNANGVILWVVLVISQIESHIEEVGVSSVFDLKQLLKNVPKTLTEFYQGILDRLRRKDSKEIEKSRYYFSWLLFSGWQLSVCEIREVMAMFNWDDLSKDERRLFLRYHCTQLHGNVWNQTWKQLHAFCGGFVEIIPYERSIFNTVGLRRDVDPDDTVQLIHRSARDFLTSSPDSKFLGIDSEGGIYSIGLACVNYYMELLLTVDHDPQAEDSVQTLCLYLERRPLLVFILFEFLRMLLIRHYWETTKLSLLYKRILEHIADAFQMQIPQAMWFFIHWDMFFSRYTGVDSFYEEIQNSKELRIFRSTLLAMAHVVLIDTSIIESLRKRMGQTEIRYDAGLLELTPEKGFEVATELQCPTALRFFNPPAGKHGRRRARLILTCRSERTVRHLVRSYRYKGSGLDEMDFLALAAKEGNATIVKELLTWATINYF